MCGVRLGSSLAQGLTRGMDHKTDCSSPMCDLHSSIQGEGTHISFFVCQFRLSRGLQYGYHTHLPSYSEGAPFTINSYSRPELIHSETDIAIAGRKGASTGWRVPSLAKDGGRYQISHGGSMAGKNVVFTGVECVISFENGALAREKWAVTRPRVH